MLTARGSSDANGAKRPLDPTEATRWSCGPYGRSHDGSMSHPQIRVIDERRSPNGDFQVDVCLVAQVDGLDGLKYPALNVPQTVTGVRLVAHS